MSAPKVSIDQASALIGMGKIMERDRILTAFMSLANDWDDLDVEGPGHNSLADEIKALIKKLREEKP